MRKILQNINERIRSFIVQTDQVALAIGCDLAGAVTVSKVIDDLENKATHDWYWVFKLDFDNPVQ
jgi:hypothetical protein